MQHATGTQDKRSYLLAQTIRAVLQCLANEPLALNTLSTYHHREASFVRAYLWPHPVLASSGFVQNPIHSIMHYVAKVTTPLCSLLILLGLYIHSISSSSVLHRPDTNVMIASSTRREGISS